MPAKLGNGRAGRRGEDEGQIRCRDLRRDLGQAEAGGHRRTAEAAGACGRRRLDAAHIDQGVYHAIDALFIMSIATNGDKPQLIAGVEAQPPVAFRP